MEYVIGPSPTSATKNKYNFELKLFRARQVILNELSSTHRSLLPERQYAGNPQPDTNLAPATI